MGRLLIFILVTMKHVILSVAQLCLCGLGSRLPSENVQVDADGQVEGGPAWVPANLAGYDWFYAGNTTNGVWYLYLNLPETWNIAENICNEISPLSDENVGRSEMAQIKSEAENAVINNWLTFNAVNATQESFWIGGGANSALTEWFWVSNPLIPIGPYTNWNGQNNSPPTYPKSAPDGYKCMNIYVSPGDSTNTGTWKNNQKCTALLPSLCEVRCQIGQ